MRGWDGEENTKSEDGWENANGQNDQDDLTGHNHESAESVIDEMSAYLVASWVTYRTKTGIDNVTGNSLSWDPLLVAAFRFTMAISDNHCLRNII